MGNINDLITKNQFSQVIKNIQSGINTVTSQVQKTAESLDLGSVTNHVTSTIGNFFDSNTKNVTREAFANIADHTSSFLTSGLSTLSKQSTALSNLSKLDLSGFNSSVSNVFSSASSLARNFSDNNVTRFINSATTSSRKNKV